MHYWKQNQGAEIFLPFLFFPFSTSHSKVMNMEIFVKVSQELLDLGL